MEITLEQMQVLIEYEDSVSLFKVSTVLRWGGGGGGGGGFHDWSVYYLLAHKKDQQLARLDKITADKLKRKQRWQLLKTQSELSKSDDNMALKQSPEVPQLTTGGRSASSPLLQSRVPQQGEREVENMPRPGEGEEQEGMEVDRTNGELSEVMFEDGDSTDKGESER